MTEGKKSNFWFTYFSSIVASCVAETVMFPIDIVKTRMQIRGEYYSRYKISTKKKGMFATAHGIVKYEGIRGLWSGLSPAMARNCLMTRIALYELFRNHFIHKDPDGNFPVWKGTLASFIAGSMGKILSVPFDSVKVEMQMRGKELKKKDSPKLYKNFIQVLAARYKAGGIKGLWKGAVPSVARAGLMSITDMCTYDNCKRFLKRKFGLSDAFPLHLICGMMAGICTTIVACPIDVIKARMMNQPTDNSGKGVYYKGTVDCFRKTVKKEGPKSLYKGFVPFWFRVGPNVVILWVVMEYLRTLFEIEGF